MTCLSGYYIYQMEKSFKKYLSGNATPEEFTAVVDELSSEQPGEKMSADLLEHWHESIFQGEAARENGSLLDRIHHRIALVEPVGATKQLSLYRNLLRIAAILILALTTSVIWMYQPQKEHIPLLVNVVDTVTTPYGARTSFRLPDGSEIWLNSGSTVTFPRQFGEVRSVKLRGEAYFKVKKDGRPFEVETSTGLVEVMGTSFDVKAYPHESFETTLVEGIVKVNDHAHRMATLKPGERSVHCQSNGFTLTTVNTDLITSWKDGKLIFVKEPFANVARELERWYNVKIVLQGERLKKLCYTGKIEMETFGEILELINITTPIHYQYNKNTRILRISGK